MPVFIQECSWTSHPGLPAMVTLYNQINKGKWSYNKALKYSHDDPQFRVSDFDNATFKGLSQMKAMPSEEREIILQCCLMVLRFMFQEFQVSFQFRKTTEDIWSGCSFGQSQYPADAGHWNQPIAAMDQAGTCSKAQLFCIYCFQMYTSGLSCKWILMSHSNEMHGETGLYCRWHLC